MYESAQTAKDRQAVRQLGGQVRLLGMVFTGVAGYGALLNLPAERPQILTSAGLITFGLHLTGKMARDCFMAANYARDPVASARQSLKSPGVVSKAIIFMAATMGLTTISDSLKESMQPAQTEITGPAPAVGSLEEKLARDGITSSRVDMKQIIREENPDCPKGRSIITKYQTSDAIHIMECTGP